MEQDLLKAGMGVASSSRSTAGQVDDVRPDVCTSKGSGGGCPPYNLGDVTN